MIIKTNLKFKGLRDYLHGTDILNTVTITLSNIFSGYISKLILRKFSKKQMSIHLTKPPKVVEIFGTGLWQVDENLSKEFWLSNNGDLITERYDYNEDKIVNNVAINGKEIIIEVKNSFSCIENIVALTKKLSYELSPLTKKQWVFGQIDLNKKLPIFWKKMSIKNSYIISLKFCKFDIEIDKNFYGKITFITSDI